MVQRLLVNTEIICLYKNLGSCGPSGPLSAIKTKKINKKYCIDNVLHILYALLPHEASSKDTYRN